MTNVSSSSSTSEGGAQPLFAWAKHNPYKEYCNNGNHQWDYQPKEAPMVARTRWQGGGRRNQMAQRRFGWYNMDWRNKDEWSRRAAIGGWHCLAVDEQGRAYAWGGIEYGQCGEEPDRKDGTGRPLRRDIVIPKICAPKLVVHQVAAGGTHSVVLACDGNIWTWGQPWPPGDIKHISVPVRVQGLESVRLIAVGAFHNLALQEDGTLWEWGNNEYGQLGTGDTQPRSQPIPVNGLCGLTLVDIAAGGWHSTALIDG
ncbi:hypothetical protein SO802_008909 [Lithocarpus litseifolius]|uniref:Uncharacterized protein n=1 Tax=Lithocarpus litseifolius TaxID=425828 RepID=A0AAW2DAI9_9ROSI